MCCTHLPKQSYTVSTPNTSPILLSALKNKWSSTHSLWFSSATQLGPQPHLPFRQTWDLSPQKRGTPKLSWLPFMFSWFSGHDSISVYFYVIPLRSRKNSVFKVALVATTECHNHLSFQHFSSLPAFHPMSSPMTTDYFRSHPSVWIIYAPVPPRNVIITKDIHIDRYRLNINI